jgi:MFS family permease
MNGAGNEPPPAGGTAGRGFNRFWTAQTISAVGSEVTSLALPLTAVLVLETTPAQMSLLTFSRTLPFLVFGLMAGVWVDRMRRRPILIASDIGRAVLLATIPLGAMLGALAMPHLYVVTFLVASIGVVSAVAYQSFVPSLVERSRLVAANSRLEATASAAAIAGPGLGGFLVQALTAPIAILVDAASFIASAALMATIRVSEPDPHASVAGERARVLIADGLRLVRDNPVLRAIVSCGTVHNFFSRMMDALYVFYLARVLDLGAGWIGVIAAMGGLGALLGALAAPRAARRLGIGRACIGAQVLTGVSRLLVPLAAGPASVVILVLALAELLLGAARPIFNINQVSMRLTITPDHQHGRVNASMRFIMWSVTPVGAALAAVVSTAIGVRQALFLAAVGVLFAALPAWRSPLRELRSVPIQA